MSSQSRSRPRPARSVKRSGTSSFRHQSVSQERQETPDGLSFDRVLFQPKRSIRIQPKSDVDAEGYAFKWMTTLERESGKKTQTLVILDRNLRNVLVDMLKDYPMHFSEADIQFDTPFEPLVQYWDRLQALVRNPDAPSQLSPTLLGDLKVLISLIEGCETLKPYFSKRPLTRGHPAIEFNDLWILYPPGQLLYGAPALSPQAFLVADCRYRREKKGDDERFIILCWSYGKL